tara:strand:- start:90 stop:260 length:171 start_codon:yes stop_codon:yes gene_type:complete
MTSKTTNKYSPEVRTRAVRMVMGHEAEAEKMKALERENRELRQANEILRKASAYFA